MSLTLPLLTPALVHICQLVRLALFWSPDHLTPACLLFIIALTSYMTTRTRCSITFTAMVRSSLKMGLSSYSLQCSAAEHKAESLQRAVTGLSTAIMCHTGLITGLSGKYSTSSSPSTSFLTLPHNSRRHFSKVRKRTRAPKCPSVSCCYRRDFLTFGTSGRFRVHYQHLPT